MHARVPTRQIPTPHTDPVVLVHGLGVSSRYMLPTLALLAPRYRVFAPDLPGFGHSVTEVCFNDRTRSTGGQLSG